MKKIKASRNLEDVAEHMRHLDGGQYQLIRIVGSGSYGIVLEAVDTLTGEKVAIKRVSPEIFQDCLLARRILREIKLLAHFDHENIICLRNILVPASEQFDMIYIVMDIMETDLKAILKSGQEMTESHVQYFVYQILRGLDCVHKASVIHRDLTPSNLLLNTNCDLKICDFGLAREEMESTGPDMTDYVVMRWYRAPELVMEHKHYTAGVDVWAAGCIMGEMLHKAKPVFPGKDRIHQLDVILETVGTPTDQDLSGLGSNAAQKYIRRKPIMKGATFATKFSTPAGAPVSPDGLDLLRRMLEFIPSKRITVHEALNHRYLAELHDPEDERQCSPGKFAFFDFPLNDLKQIRRLIVEEIKLIHARNLAKRPPSSPATTDSPTTCTLPQPDDGEGEGPRTAFVKDAEAEEGEEADWDGDAAQPPVSPQAVV